MGSLGFHSLNPSTPIGATTSGTLLEESITRDTVATLRNKKEVHISTIRFFTAFPLAAFPRQEHLASTLSTSDNQNFNMPENNPSPAHAEEDELASFLPVLAVVRLDSVPGMATKIWDSKHPKDRLARPPVVEAPLHGSFNILFPIEFRDRGISWLLKIPINGTPRHWNTLCADELESEARTM